VASWALENNGCYSTKSLYRFLGFGGVVRKSMSEIWSAKILLKVKKNSVTNVP
jgi:hypothetical protein